MILVMDFMGYNMIQPKQWLNMGKYGDPQKKHDQTWIA